MGKIVYLETTGNGKDARRRSRADSQTFPKKTQKLSARDYQKFVADNIARLNAEKLALDQQSIGSDRPPSYRTTRVYEISSIFNDFDLVNGPIKRLLQQHPDHHLPSVAVVHSSQMRNAPKPIFLLGRSIFMTHDDFERWVKGRTDHAFEDGLLLLLTKYLTIGNTAPA